MSGMTNGPTVNSAGSDQIMGRTDFSLVLGGPLFQLLRRAHLSDDAFGRRRPREVPRCNAPADCGGTRRAPSHAHRDAHPAGSPAGPGGCHGRAGRGDRLGVSTAQLGGRRVVADGLRVRGRNHGGLAPLPGAGHGHLVRDAGRGWLQPDAGGHPVRLRRPADLPVPARPVVFPAVHLDSTALEDLTDPAESGNSMRNGCAGRRTGTMRCLEPGTSSRSPTWATVTRISAACGWYRSRRTRYCNSRWRPWHHSCRWY